MSDYKLEVGINLDNRKLNVSIPVNTPITQLKYIAKTHNSNNYIYEDNHQAFIHYVEDGEEYNVYFYDDRATLIPPFITLPKNFGTIIEVDEKAVCYPYIKRVVHDKVYVITEDFAKKESMDREQIENEVEYQVRSYRLPENSVVGFDGTTIPDGFEEVTDDYKLNFTSQITFNETVTDATRFNKVGDMVFVQLQGENIARSHDQVIGTIPEAYKPAAQVFALAMIGTDKACNVFISSTTGQIKVQMTGTSTGRITSNFTYKLS